MLRINSAPQLMDTAAFEEGAAGTVDLTGWQEDIPGAEVIGGTFESSLVSEAADVTNPLVSGCAGEFSGILETEENPLLKNSTGFLA